MAGILPWGPAGLCHAAVNSARAASSTLARPSAAATLRAGEEVLTVRSDGG